MKTNINPKNWIEDFPHENGQYQCRCVYCKSLFEGHKRRVVCKVCDAVMKLKKDTENPVDNSVYPVNK